MPKIYSKTLRAKDENGEWHDVPTITSEEAMRAAEDARASAAAAERSAQEAEEAAEYNSQLPVVEAMDAAQRAAASAQIASQSAQNAVNTANEAMETAEDAAETAENAVATAVAAVPANVTNWLEDNVTPVGSAVTVDKSLSVESSAADAKAVGDAVTDLKSAITDITGDTQIPLVANKYIDLSGSSVTMSGGVPQYATGTTTFLCGYMACSVGERFIINGHGGGQTRLWAFINSSGEIITKSNASASGNNTLIIAPENSTYIIVHTNDGRHSYKTGDNILLNKIGHYLTVSAMQSDASLIAGMTAKTLGYFEANDGGGAIYNIASSREHSYDVALNNGLFAILVINGDVDGAQLGCIDENATYTRLNNALQCAVDYNADLVFSRDIYTTTTIVIRSDLNKKHIRFKRIYYQHSATPETPDGTAVIFENCRDITVDCDAVIAGNPSDDTAYMTAFRYKQSIASTEKYIFNVNINCNYAWASGMIVNMEPTAGGILECKINIGEASAKSYVFRLYPHGTVEPTPPKEMQACYIGQCYFSANHITSRSDAYAVYLTMDTSHIAALNTTIQNLITGVAFDITSFEGSKKGLYMNGDVKMITFEGLRVFEENNAEGPLIRSQGWIRHIYIKGLTPIRYDKTSLSTEYSPASANFVLDGGILSNTGFDFAKSLLVSNKGITFKAHGPLFWNRTTDFQFNPTESTNARLITHFRNATADSDPLNAKNLNLTNLSYFDPYGVDTIYLTQNRTAGATFTLYDGDNVVFDGSTMTEEGEHTYAVTVQYDNTNINNFIKVYLIRLVK